MVAAELFRRALELDTDQRADLALELLRSLEPCTSAEEVRASWNEEIRRRVARVRGGEEELIPAAVSLQRARAALPSA